MRTDTIREGCGIKGMLMLKRCIHHARWTAEDEPSSIEKKWNSQRFFDRLRMTLKREWGRRPPTPQAGERPPYQPLPQFVLSRADKISHERVPVDPPGPFYKRHPSALWCAQFGHENQIRHLL